MSTYLQISLTFDITFFYFKTTELDWDALRARIAKFGVRNSLLMAPMPTASTAQILGNNESIEAYTSNIYSRRVLSGEFQIVNQHLLKGSVSKTQFLFNYIIVKGRLAAKGIDKKYGIGNDAMPKQIMRHSSFNLYGRDWHLRMRCLFKCLISMHQHLTVRDISNVGRV